MVTPTNTLMPTNAASNELSGASQGEHPAEITFPSILTVGHSTVIPLEIILDPQFVSTGTGVINIVTNSANGIPRISIKIVVPVYQVMKAELVAAGFDISPSTIDTERFVSQKIAKTTSLTWTWNVIANEPDLQTMTINFYDISYVSGQKFSNLVHSESLEILVQDKPFLEKATNTFSAAWPAVFGTGVGLLIAFMTIWQNKKRSKEREDEIDEKYKELNQKITELQLKAMHSGKKSSKKPTSKPDTPNQSKVT